MQIIVYSTTSCPYCKMLKNYLLEKKVVYTEKNIDTDEKAKKEMMENSGGFLGVPFVVIIKDDGSKSSIVGFDKGEIDKAI